MIILTQTVADNFFNLTIPYDLPAGNYYRMTFKSTYSVGNNYVLLPTVVQNNARYTQFQIDCSQTSPEPLDGAINFSPAGTYTWELDIALTRSLTAASGGVWMTDLATVNSCDSNGNNIYNFVTIDGEI